ncbi:hypothetical protein HK105_202176 [Polyrhizophydium stewartii]|uniref:Transmembrane protein n=1 Tax=Polyrhizophydium stewartii TaxID=2732419 RepID=A0ABR4NFD8_9FUNG
MSLASARSIAGLLLVALCWGFTNPFIKAGSAGLEAVSKAHAASPWWKRQAAEAWFLATRWQYVVPLAINLSGSTVYYYMLGEADLSLAVPIANSLTFAFTTLAGIALGESFGSWDRIAGMACVFVGVLLCVRSNLAPEPGE